MSDERTPILPDSMLAWYAHASKADLAEALFRACMIIIEHGDPSDDVEETFEEAATEAAEQVRATVEHVGTGRTAHESIRAAARGRPIKERD